MKIQAKDVQVGMTVKWGVVTLTVNEIVPFTAKNGREGKVFFGPAIRSYGRGVKPRHFQNEDISVWSESWLSIKTK